MKTLTFAAFLLASLGLVGCFYMGEALRDNPEEYRHVLGTAYVLKTPFSIYKHQDDKKRGNFISGEGFYYSLYPSTEGGHVNNRYSRLLGRLSKGDRLRVTSIKQGVESKKVAYIVKIEESRDEILQGAEAVIRAYTEDPALYVQDENGYWDLSSRWLHKEEAPKAP
ncbi:hypothetical protein [Cephaloticoccus primus]|nr:hypothetical protein [Cephaloticoccus primus]